MKSKNSQSKTNHWLKKKKDYSTMKKIPKKFDYGSGVCIIKECNHNRIYDFKNQRFMPVCGYDCFQEAERKGMFKDQNKLKTYVNTQQKSLKEEFMQRREKAQQKLQ